MKSMNTRWITAFVLLIVLVTTACGFDLGAGDQPDGSPDLEYFTEFEDMDDWELYSMTDLEDYDIESTSDGTYVSLNNGMDIIYGYVDEWHADVSVEMSVQYVSGNADLSAEVVCRSSDIGEYIFEMNYEGYYFIWYFDVDSEEYIELDAGETSAINSGDQSNKLIAECVDNELDFYINGKHVSSITDNTLDSGYVGFGLETYDEFTSDVLLVDFSVYDK